jgi:nicotinate-nucleotide pyrophosphorylase (carboxylating)
MDFPALEDLIRRAFAEDCVDEDVTSLACIEEGRDTKASILLKQDGCIAGLKFLPQVFSLRDPRLVTEVFVPEGTRASKGTILARVRGSARSILSAERVALNLVQHLSGIATLTALCVDEAKGTKCEILDTRKTIWGFRALQKYAVRMGGGKNQRLHLADRILIKNNHLALAGVEECLRDARAKFPTHRIQIEARSEDEFQRALAGRPDSILLDNMSPEEVRDCVQRNHPAIYLEASGSIRLNNLGAYARTGIDGVSIGALTHSAPALDISLRIGETI